jgi:hypothetical protein
VRNASARKPCSASAQAQGSAGDTHRLRDGDKAEADEREQAAAMPASSGNQIQRGSNFLIFRVSFSFSLTLYLSHSISLSLFLCPMPFSFRVSSARRLSLFSVSHSLFYSVYIQIKLIITLSTEASSTQ